MPPQYYRPPQIGVNEYSAFFGSTNFARHSKALTPVVPVKTVSELLITRTGFYLLVGAVTTLSLTTIGLGVGLGVVVANRSPTTTTTSPTTTVPQVFR